MRAGAAVRVDDDLAAGEPGVAHRPADHEDAGRVDVKGQVPAVHHVRGQDREDDVLDDLLAEALVRDRSARAGWRRRRSPPAPACRRRSGRSPGDLPSGRRYGERARPGGPAERRRTRPWASEIGAGISSGVSLQAYPNMRPWSPAPSLSVPWSTPMGDVGRLLVDGDDHAAGVAVEAVLGPRVADVPDGLARDLGDVHVAGRRDLARHDDEPGGEERLARHAARAGPAPGSRPARRRRSGRRSCRGGPRSPTPR